MTDNKINQAIKARSVRLISSDGTQLGIVSLRQALEAAEKDELDLVQVSNSEPPVCKIMDYSKFKFEQKKKAKEQKRNQTVIEVKEIQITRTTAENDLRTKANQISKFLEKGNHVRITLKLRGRENVRPEMGIDAVNNFLQILKDMRVNYKLKQNVKLNGRMVECAILPE